MSEGQWDIDVLFWRAPWPPTGRRPNPDFHMRIQADSLDAATAHARSLIDFEPAHSTTVRVR